MFLYEVKFTPLSSIFGIGELSFQQNQSYFDLIGWSRGELDWGFKMVKKYMTRKLKRLVQLVFDRLILKRFAYVVYERMSCHLDVRVSN